MVGLARMSANTAQRPLHGGHRVTGFDSKPQARQALVAHHAACADSLHALVKALPMRAWCG